MRRKIIPYNPDLKQKARYLRKNSTLSEVLLWNYLKGRQMKVYDFHRQKPIGRYIVDFFCIELMLAIEIDGDSHNYKVEKDEERQKVLESMGIRFLRYNDRDVKHNIEGVLRSIEEWIEHTPGPSQEGNEHTPGPSQEGIEHTPGPSQEGNL